MKSVVAKQSVVIDGHKTSVSVEDSFWSGLKEIAERRGMHLFELLSGPAARAGRSIDGLTEALAAKEGGATHVKKPGLWHEAGLPPWQS